MKAWLGPDARSIADLAADMGGVPGGVTDTLDRLFALAKERGPDVDQTDHPMAFIIPKSPVIGTHFPDVLPNTPAI